MYLTARQKRMGVVDQIGEDRLVKLEVSFGEPRCLVANHSQVTERARVEKPQPQPAPKVSSIVHTEA
jgi:hypothetical protein